MPKLIAKEHYYFEVKEQALDGCRKYGKYKATVYTDLPGTGVNVQAEHVAGRSSKFFLF